jgi:hypothetical protein
MLNAGCWLDWWLVAGCWLRCLDCLPSSLLCPVSCVLCPVSCVRTGWLLCTVRLVLNRPVRITHCVYGCTTAVAVRVRVRTRDDKRSIGPDDGDAEREPFGGSKSRSVHFGGSNSACVHFGGSCLLECSRGMRYREFGVSTIESDRNRILEQSSHGLSDVFGVSSPACQGKAQYEYSLVWLEA